MKSGNSTLLFDMQSLDSMGNEIKEFQLFKSRDPSRVHRSPILWMFDLCNFMDFSLPMTCPLSLHHYCFHTSEMSSLSPTKNYKIIMMVRDWIL